MPGGCSLPNTSQVLKITCAAEAERGQIIITLRSILVAFVEKSFCCMRAELVSNSRNINCNPCEDRSLSGASNVSYGYCEHFCYSNIFSYTSHYLSMIVTCNSKLIRDDDKDA